MKTTENKLKDLIKEIIEEELNEAGSIGGHTVGDFDLGANYYVSPKRDDKKSPHHFLQAYSSKEAKSVIDGALKNWAKELRQVQYKVIKDWMTAAKSGTIDYFDLVRGLTTGDIARAKPFETKFLMAVLNRDKIIDRFRKYYGGKKGKRGRRK